jgi:uncharacterized membrane protein
MPSRPAAIYPQWVTLIDPVRLQEHVHGHIGWLAAIALIHPAIVLRRPKRRAHLAVGLAVGVVTLAGALGAAIYGDYRERLRQSIFQHARVIGYLFERKEHLAFGAVVLAYAGAAAYVAATKLEGERRERLRKAAHWSFVAAAAMAVVTAALGTVIAAYKTF